MKLNMTLSDTGTTALKFFADVVLWSGEALSQEVQGRMTLEGATPDPGGNCPELERLSVLDECARAVDARVEFASDGAARVLGRLELPLEAELRDGLGNTYTAQGVAVYALNLDAPGISRGDCGEVLVGCEARELSVQAMSRECVTYAMKLDVRAYLARRELIELELVNEECECCAWPRVPSADARAGDAQAQAADSSDAATAMAAGARAARTGSVHVGCTLDALAAGAARNRGARLAPAQPAPAQPAPNPAALPADEDEDAYRTVVKLPLRRRRR